MDEYRRGRIDGAKAERELWSEWILLDPLVRAEWDACRGDREEFSADDAANLLFSLVRELKVARTSPEFVEIRQINAAIVEENMALRQKLDGK